MRIFISPLDWGLGHASRCIPIIHHLLEKKIEVVIGAEGPHLLFLKEHFLNVDFVDFPGYRIKYSTALPVGVKVLFQLPQMVAAIKKEHELLETIIKDKNIDAAISDNRYGLWNKKIPSIIITHQLNIQAPAANTFLSKTAYNYIKNFDECWIPDYSGDVNLSGTLSHPIPKGLNGKYVGPLSRFDTLVVQPQTPKGALNSAAQSPFRGLGFNQNKKYDLLVILSGPEPQRSKLEEIILNQLKDLPKTKALIIQGLPGSTYPLAQSLPSREGRNVQIIPHLGDTDFQDAVNNSEVILSRGGYSTIMDLHTIGWKKSIFIPTPGQTEQEYLAKQFEKRGMAITFTQKGLSLKDALEKANELNPVEPAFEKENYKKVVDEWLKKISS